MGPGPGSRRPVGWWVKEADRRLDAAFDGCLRAGGADRRTWQVLASLAGRPLPLDELVAQLAPFDSPERVAGVVDDLRSRGLVDDSGGEVRSTPDGERLRADLAPQVDEVRRRVAAALPGDESRQRARRGRTASRGVAAWSVPSRRSPIVQAARSGEEPGSSERTRSRARPGRLVG